MGIADTSSNWSEPKIHVTFADVVMVVTSAVREMDRIDSFRFRSSPRVRAYGISRCPYWREPPITSERSTYKKNRVFAAVQLFSDQLSGVTSHLKLTFNIGLRCDITIRAISCRNQSSLPVASDSCLLCLLLSSFQSRSTWRQVFSELQVLFLLGLD